MTSPTADSPQNSAPPADFGFVRLRQAILPVLDLMGGHVVRGIAGRRDQYRPIVSRICHDSRPLPVAHAMRDRYGFHRFYVADLDAIRHRQPHTCALDQLCADGFELLVDAGVRSVDDTRRLLDTPIHRVVLGLESLASPADLCHILDAVDHRRLVFSLDMMAGRPIASAAWPLDPLALAERAVTAGVPSLILLDLSAVGIGAGLATGNLARRCRKLHPSLELITGGGVRSIDDLQFAIGCGANQILVASALHDGHLDSLWPGASESTQPLL